MLDLKTTSQVETAFDRLFPLCRSIMGKGYRDSLKILEEYVPFHEEEYLSGEKVLNWEVPQEWVIRDAWIKDENGNKIVDFNDSNLHVVNYSEPIDKVLSLNELKEHIYVSDSDENAIPYTISYYKKRWGFCISKKQFEQLEQGNYHAYIDSEFVDGKLVVGQVVLQGECQKEILLTSYLCHPSMANNELSGPLVLAMLYQKISQWKKRKYTYRFVINPETIGCISFLSSYGDVLKENIFAGLVLNCLGGNQLLRYKCSKSEESPFDQLVRQIEEVNEGTFRISSFDPTSGSDERQYCSPGYNFPVGQFAKLVYGTYKEYHTSLDTKELMGIDNIIDSANQIEKFLMKHEEQRYFINLFPNGEVKLGDYGLYPSVNSDGIHIKSSTNELIQQPWFVSTVMFLLSYADGKHSLTYCAHKLNKDIETIKMVAEILQEKGLIKEVNIGEK